MGKYTWHVSRVGENPKITRHYNWITKMYRFVLRNPAMFKGKQLTIYNHDKKVIDLSYEDVRYRHNLALKENDERKVILEMGRKKEVHDEGN